MAKTEFVKVEKHLYKYQHQDKTGQWSTRYYAVFVDWQGNPHRDPLGDNLKIARDRLGELLTLNGRRFDFAAAKRQKEEEAKKQAEAAKKGLTLGEFAAHYFEKLAPSFEKRDGSREREQRLWAKLEDHFGPKLLTEIKLTAVAEYRVRREREVSFVTANRELAFIRYLLNRANEDGALDAVPKIKLKSEKGRARTHTVSPEEYKAILSGLKRPQQRYVICLHETAMRRDEPLKMTWEMVDFKAGLLRLPKRILKEKTDRRTPISAALLAVLEELRAEQKRVPNVGNFVFTRPNGRPIKTIRTAFDLALERAKLEDIVLHDFRRTAITFWTACGIARDIVMACSGHARGSVHDGYINFSDSDLTSAFAELMVPASQRAKRASAAAL